MNRRGFLNSLLKVGAAAAVAPAILPAATTYLRRWKRPAGIRFFIPMPQRIFPGNISACSIQMLTAAELDALFMPVEPVYSAYMELMYKTHPNFKEYGL